MPELNLESFKEICHQHGHFTRLVRCAISLEYAPYDPYFEEEYLQLGQGESLRPWESLSHGKDQDAMLFKALSDIYDKLMRIEQALEIKQRHFIPLESQGLLEVLGHGVLGVRDPLFESNQEYYLRFSLPSAPYRVFALSARAFDAKLLKVARMHPAHIKEMDSYIAAQELATLKGLKTCN
ncbi:hypothetical protein [Helicobacter salomonis]|uniref:hypothetical protein n=1 Tax=Helicobacter salomonis TaxID=56878 RepID=UPI000CF18AA3|nr:hypothetical protein [Helicobacter salomonis]